MPYVFRAVKREIPPAKSKYVSTTPPPVVVAPPVNRLPQNKSSAAPPHITPAKQLAVGETVKWVWQGDNNAYSEYPADISEKLEASFVKGDENVCGLPVLLCNMSGAS